MSDLDDFFAKRLDEEANFPNRGKNWKQLSKQLDAFHTGSVQGNRPGLRGWQIATIAALAVSGLLLLKTIATQQEKTKLRQDVASLQTERANLIDQLAAVEKRAIAPSIENISNDIPSNTSVHTTNPNFSVDRKINERLPNKVRATTRIDSTKIPIEKLQQPNGAAEKLPAPIAENPTVKQSLSTAIEEKSPLTSDVTAFIQKEDTAKLGIAIVDSAAVALSVSVLDSTKNASPEIDSLLALVEKLKDSLSSAPSLVQEIKPAHNKKSRFRVGAQATLGFIQPKQKGVSSVRGQGFTLEARIFRSLWATASVDWLHHEVSTDGFVPKFHPHHDSLPKPPDGGWGGGGGGGWQHQSKLIRVESAPQQQHFGLGLRYQLPVRFWVRPSVRVAYNWVHISPTLVTYKFVEDDPGGPGPNPYPDEHDVKYTAEKFDAQWLTNQLRFGVGLEKDIPNWTFGLWADYSKDFSAATPSFDVLYLRAGAQYRF